MHGPRSGVCVRTRHLGDMSNKLFMQPTARFMKGSAALETFLYGVDGRVHGSIQKFSRNRLAGNSREGKILRFIDKRQM